MGTGSDTLTWVRVVDLDDLWEGELIGVKVGDEELIVVHLEGGHIGAFLAACPHQGTSLASGYLEGETLVCQAHLWEFDARTGAGINPSTSCLLARPVRVEADAVWIGQADSKVAASAEKGNEADGD